MKLLIALLLLAATASAQNNSDGTLVSAPIRPKSVNDTFPTAFANEVRGGPFSVASVSAMSNIPVSRLVPGSLVYITGDSSFRLYDTSSNWTSTLFGISNVAGLSVALNGKLESTNSAADIAARSYQFQPATNNEPSLYSQLGLASSAGGEYGGFYSRHDGLYKLAFASGNSTNSLTDRVIFRSGSLQLRVPLQFVGIDAASVMSVTRTNLGLPWSGLTNTSAVSFRQAIGVAGPAAGSVLLNPEVNTAIATYSTVSGGINNQATANYATIVGGNNNQATASYAAIVGGYDQSAAGIYSFIGGGQFNDNPSGTHTVIAGGQYNSALANYAAVLSGKTNIASASYATVLGGLNNTASGGASVVVGGYLNTASGDYSLAAGRSASATNSGSFVWADNQATAFGSTNTNSFSVRATGGMSVDLGDVGIAFRNSASAGATRTNLGLGLGSTVEVGFGTVRIPSPTGISFIEPIDNETVLFLPLDADPVGINPIHWNHPSVRTSLGLPLSALTNTSNAAMMRALSGSTNNSHPFSGSISVVGTTNTNTLVFSNGILQSIQ